MLELCTSAYQGAFDADSIRIANGGYDEVAQIETSRSLLLPIVEAAQGVGKIDAAVKICHLAAEVNIGHSVWDGGKPRTAGIAKEVAIHAVQAAVSRIWSACRTDPRLRSHIACHQPVARYVFQVDSGCSMV